MVNFGVLPSGASPGAHASDFGITAKSTIFTADRGGNIPPRLNQFTPKALIDGTERPTISGTDTIGDNEDVFPGVEPGIAGTGSLTLSGEQDSGDASSHNISKVAAGTVHAGPIVGIISDTAHVGFASIPALDGNAKGAASGIGSGVFPPHNPLLGPANNGFPVGNAKGAASGIGSGVFPPHNPLMGPANNGFPVGNAKGAASGICSGVFPPPNPLLGPANNALDNETCASHHAGANYPYARALSWAPKNGSNTELQDHGSFSQIEHSGKDAIGARSLEGVPGDSIAAAQAIPGTDEAINAASTWPFQQSKLHSAPTSSVLNGTDPLNSNPATGAPDPPIKSWKSLVSTPVKKCGPLQFYMPHYTDGKIIAKPPVEAVNEGIDMWKGCLVGQFLDKRLPYPVVRSLVNRLWGKREMPDISTTESGLFFFRFRDPEARDWVMNAGPWHLAGRPFILRAWKPGMDMLNIQLSSIPIWVRFYNIPLEYWTSTCLGHIASTIGIPLHLDPLTENKSKLSFARIFIEVGVDCEFPKSVLLDRGNGSYSTIRIEYPWAPQCCSKCNLFGHNLANCQAKKMPSNGMISLNPGNGNNEAVIGKDIVNEGEGLEIAAEYTTLVPIPTVTHAATETTCPVSIPTVAHAKAGIQLNEEDINAAILNVTPLLGNSFECLAQCEVEEVDEAKEACSPNNNSEHSDNSPLLDTFKHIKRVDELDFTPVPMSRKKLKKLKKRSLACKQGSVVGGEGNRPNG